MQNEETKQGMKDFDRLVNWFKSYDSCIIAFSSGVDSSLLAFCAKRALGGRAYAVTSISPSFSRTEKQEAQSVSREIGIELIVVEQDDLGTSGYVSNGVNRCYFCRNNLASAILPIARRLSVSVCVDGTHADDMRTPRPGIKALREAGFRAPFVELGMDKESVRSVARFLGLSNCDRPSEACLSSRIAFGQKIDLQTLRRIEAAEDVVKKITGARIVRVRTIETKASVEVDKETVNTALSRKESVKKELLKLGYQSVEIDPNGYTSGKMLQLFVKDNT